MLVSVSQIHKGFSGILRAETINGTRQFEGMVGLSSPENAFFSSSDARKIFECNTPSISKKLTTKFQKRSPNPLGFVFLPGATYFYIGETKISFCLFSFSDSRNYKSAPIAPDYFSHTSSDYLMFTAWLAVCYSFVKDWNAEVWRAESCVTRKSCSCVMCFWQWWSDSKSFKSLLLVAVDLSTRFQLS